MSTSSGKKSKSGQSRSTKPNSPNTANSTQSTQSTQSVNQPNQVEQNPTIFFCLTCHVIEVDLKSTTGASLRSCSGCKNKSTTRTFYCSILCQRTHWRNGHKNECGKEVNDASNTNASSSSSTFFSIPIDLSPSPNKIFKRPTQLFTPTPNRYLLRQFEYLESHPGVDYAIFTDEGVVEVVFRGADRGRRVRSRDALLAGISIGVKGDKAIEITESNFRAFNAFLFASIIARTNCMNYAFEDRIDCAQLIANQLGFEFEVVVDVQLEIDDFTKRGFRWQVNLD